MAQEPITKVYEYLDRCNREEVATYRFRGRRFNPSGMHKCPRALYYRHTGEVPRVVPGFISLYGQDGDIAHDSVRWLMKKAGVQMKWLDFDEEKGTIEETGYFRKEVTHNGQTFTISGRADGLVLVESEAGDEWMPLEIKSIDGFKYKYILKAYQEGNLHEYLMEGNKGNYRKWYMQTTLTAHFMGYDKTYMVFKDRSLCQIGMYDKVNDVREGGCIMPVNQEMLKGMLNKMAMVDKCVDDGVPPMLALCPVEGSYECDRLCEYNHICRKKE